LNNNIYIFIKLIFDYSIKFSMKTFELAYAIISSKQFYPDNMRHIPMSLLAEYKNRFNI